MHNDIADRFFCLVNVPETSSTKERVQYSECCEEVINTYLRREYSTLSVVKK